MVSSNGRDSDVLKSVVTAVADCRGVDPLELEPLADAIDPALLTGYATSEAVLPGSELRFGFAGCLVRITGDGDVVVRGPE